MYAARSAASVQDSPISGIFGCGSSRNRAIGCQKVITVNDNHVRREANDFQRETPHAFGIATAEPIFKMNVLALCPAGLRKSPL